MRSRIDTRKMLLSGGREAVKTMWQTANIIRKDGFGAAVRSSIEDLADWAAVDDPTWPAWRPTVTGHPVLRHRRLHCAQRTHR